MRHLSGDGFNCRTRKGLLVLTGAEAPISLAELLPLSCEHFLIRYRYHADGRPLQKVEVSRKDMERFGYSERIEKDAQAGWRGCPVRR